MDARILRRYGLAIAIEQEKRFKVARACQHIKEANPPAICAVCKLRDYCGRS